MEGVDESRERGAGTYGNCSDAPNSLSMKFGEDKYW